MELADDSGLDADHLVVLLVVKIAEALEETSAIQHTRAGKDRKFVTAVKAMESESSAQNNRNTVRSNTVTKTAINTVRKTAINTDRDTVRISVVNTVRSTARNTVRNSQGHC